MSVISNFASFLSVRAIVKAIGVAILAALISVPAHAKLISAQEASIESAGNAVIAPRADLHGLFDREEVVRALQNNGVSIEMARERLAALTDEEARQLQSDIESAPAGSGVVGAAVLIFLVLLATDITGYTDVFPFTRKAR
ncbi:MAG: PA2779 family protein [Burkholderiaceae bacterium]